jgi:hypothetical protein
VNSSFKEVKYSICIVSEEHALYISAVSTRRNLRDQNKRGDEEADCFSQKPKLGKLESSSS